MNGKNRFPVWLVYVLPVVLWGYVYAANGYFLLTNARVYREYGLIENLTALVLLVAIFYFLLCLRRAGALWEKGWFLVLSVGTVYFLGEEVSWGYHLFNFQPTEVWEEINDQGEPNLHNLTGVWEVLFDKLPRQLLSVGVVIGGLLGWRAHRCRGWPSSPSLRRLIPAGETLFIAVIGNLVSVPEKIADHLLSTTPGWLVLGNASGELKELFLALFIVLYAYVMWRKFRVVSNTDE